MFRYFLILLFTSITNVQSSEVDATMNWANVQRVGFVVEGEVNENVVKIGEKVENNELLAQLNALSFGFIVRQRLAQINQITPLLLDAKLDLHHAEELYERTVLSEVELQKIKGKYEALVAKKDEAQSRYQLAQWKLEKTMLKANKSAYVIASNIFPGMVISNENKADMYIELASVKQAAAIAWLSASQKESLSLGDKLQVKIENLTIPATISSLGMKPNHENKYRIDVLYDYTKVVTPGRIVTLSFN